MNKIFKFLFRKPLLLIFLFSLVSLTWFRNDLLLAGGDAYGFINPSTLTNFTKYVWNVKLSNAGGIIFSTPNLFPWLYFFTFFQSLGWSLISAEKLWFFLLFLLPGLSMYYLMSEIYNKNWAKIISSTFYMFNLFLVTVGIVQTNIKLVFIALPIMLLFWIKGLSKIDKSFFKYSVLVSLCSLVYTSSNINVPSIVVIPITLFVYLMFFLISSVRKKENFWQIFKFTGVTIALYLLLNLWWITDFVINIIPGVDSVRKGVSFLALETGGIMESLRLLGSWGWKGGSYQMNYFPFAFNYDKPFLLILTFLLTFLVFLAVFLKPKNKNILFFSFLVIVGLFLAKGGADPFGYVYIWLWSNFPGFWMFREPFAKFTPVTVFAYSVLLGISVDLINQRIKGFKLLLRYKGFYKSFSNNIFPSLIMVTLLVVSYPLINGEFIWDSWNGSMRTLHVKVPEYWHELREWLDQNDKYSRVFLTPKSGYGVAYNWEQGFSSADSPANFLINNPTLRFASNSDFSADKLVSEIYDYVNLGEKQEFIRSLAFLNTKYVLQQNDLDWSFALKDTHSPNQMSEFFQFMDGISKIESFGQLDLFKIKDENFLPHFYIPKFIIYSNGEIQNLPDIVSLNDYKIRSGIYLGTINGLTDSKIGGLKERADEIVIKTNLDDHFLPGELLVSIPPDFLPYISQAPDNRFHFIVLLKEKYDKWKIKGQPENLFYKELYFSNKRIQEFIKFPSVKAKTSDELITQYKQQMESALKIAVSLNNKKLFTDYINYIKWQKEIVANSAGLSKWISIFDELERKTEKFIIKRNFYESAYNFEIPKEGEYDIYLKYIKGLKINGLTNSLSTTFEKDGDWIKLGRRNFNKEKQEISLPMSRISENVIDDKLVIKDISPDSIYRISFDYQSTENFNLLIKENGYDKEIAKTKIYSDVDSIQKFESFFKTSPEATTAAIQFVNNKKEEIDLDYRNLQVNRIYEPTVVLKSIEKINDINELMDYRNTIPKITFMRINPTKYRVKVEGAKDPYTLVFSESFNKRWKVYLSNQQSVISNQLYGETVASYFNGDIKEGTHRNTFLEKATFETWGKKAISEDKHLLVNGYANSWYITPEDAGGKENYELIIEFAPQRLFYIGLFVSFFTLVSCLSYLFVTIAKNLWKRNS